MLTILLFLAAYALTILLLAGLIDRGHIPPATRQGMPVLHWVVKSYALPALLVLHLFASVLEALKHTYGDFFE